MVRQEPTPDEPCSDDSAPGIAVRDVYYLETLTKFPRHLVRYTNRVVVTVRQNEKVTISE
jgi:hypothetical protein